MNLRKPTTPEAKLMKLLVETASVTIPPNWHEDLLVMQMDDGGMGSLLLFPKGFIAEHRMFGALASQHLFQDTDGVDVLAFLNMDRNGHLFELDIWKTDFNPLKQFPEL